MKPLKIFFLAMLCAGFGLPALAQQQKLTMHINYAVNTPTGSFKSDLVSKTSFRGWNANVLYGVTDRLSLGLEAGFNDYYQKYPRQVYDTKDGAISAVLSNSIQTVPVMLKGRFNLAPSGMVQPYVGAGVGGNFVSYSQYLGEFAGSKSGVYFAASPEAGIAIPFRKHGASAFTLGGRYNFMPFSYSDNKNLNNWGLYAGIKFPLK
ncbi:outer membrane beta-barrel protein [Agriterribacter sp.]|uniref:outer membrane beta-barrel protein n=1 Tax=Agriterribacter sp. TaxID=2821509 RepID=UPI002CE5B11E|nr:outer membrane beta-barrel protein [Agriterribacter sp.]HRO46070.1 OmpW family outer membrane protein [Agriterribacter sp.]HRQ16130.1 OmpW family outer membrane protein [Agriterribacter sp.]